MAAATAATLNGTGDWAMVARLVLHAGTPKTGTTSLQTALARNRPALAERGIVYPSTGHHRRHQWLVNDLIAGSAASLTRNLGVVFDEAGRDCHTILLSAEGLFNHWWDFSDAGRAALGELATQRPVEVWVWFRNPVEFCCSLFVQNLKNRPGAVRCYGRDWSVDDMLDDPWFARHLDYAAFLDDVATVLRPSLIRPFAYRGDTVGVAFAALGCAGLPTEGAMENKTLGACGVDLLRCLNRRHLTIEQRLEAVDMIIGLDRRLGDGSGVFRLERQTQARIRACTAESTRRLLRDYGIDLG